MKPYTLAIVFAALSTSLTGLTGCQSFQFGDNPIPVISQPPITSTSSN